MSNAALSWARAQRGMTTYLYVFAADRAANPLCKVGLSASPEKRLRSLQTACPYPLKIVELWDFPDREFASEAENLAHAALKKFSTHGEWFAIAAIEAVYRITLWMYFAAKHSANGNPVPAIPEKGVGLLGALP